MTPGDEAPRTDYTPDGVDLTLIRWMLSLTPAERLEFLEDHLKAIVSIRERNAEPRPTATLRALREGAVDFIVVGGVAAVLNGAPINTFDVDVVHSRDAANIDRLLPVLEDLDAIFRMQSERRLKPNASHLASAGYLNLTTRYGPLDLLGTIGNNLGYQELLPHSSELDIADGLRMRVLNLEKLIALKEELGGEKDRAVLPILRRTLEEKRKAEQG